MKKFSELLQAQPFEAAPVHTALERLGLGEWTTVNRKQVFSTNRAARLIEGLAKEPVDRAALFAVLDDLLQDLGEAAAPLRALVNLARLVDVIGDKAAFYLELQNDPAMRGRLCRLLSFSQALADVLIRQPELLELMRVAPQSLSRAELRRKADTMLQDSATPQAQLEKLRRFRRRETLRIGLLDMQSQTWRDVEDFEAVVHQISDLAQVCVEQTLAILIQETAPIGKANNRPGLPFTVLAMGKLGARELNYSSDIDLVFIHDGEDEAMQKLGQRLLNELTASTTEGTLYRVDMRLRPEGKSGPLVTSLDYALSYYESYAAAWEWQALIKARVIAGDARLGRRFRKFTRGVTWAKRADDAHLREILDMKRRSETTAEGSDPTNVKQGPGGIRDAEWTVQQLQMMVGPEHPRVRAHDTLRAVEALEGFGALSFEEANRLRDGYLFLRVIEHRLQLLDERAVRTLPKDEAERVALARRTGCPWRGPAALRWLEEEHTRHRADIRALCERMFWGWQDTAEGERGRGGEEEKRRRGKDGQEVSDHSNGDAGDSHSPSPPLPLSPSPLLTADAQRRVQRIAEGTATHPFPAPLARQIHSALPDVLRYLEHAANPDRALVNLERLCDASGNRLSLLRALGQATNLARAVFAILGGSQFLSDTLIRFPELLDLAAQRSAIAEPKTWEEARADCRSYCLTFRDRAAALRRWKRREMLRIGLRDLALDAPPLEITREIADLAQACLALACDEVGANLRPASERITFCVLGMGKLGGGEMHYASDADVLFSYQVPTALAGNEDDTNRYASLGARWAEDLTRYMSERTEEGVCFAVDARLRPEGRNGPLAPPVAGYIQYFENPTNGIAIWERQALTRARYVAGDAETAAELLAAIHHVAYPEQWRPEWGDELRHIKSRVEKERAARGSSSGSATVFDVKLGRGGLSDIEFCAQWLALKNGGRVPALQTPNTLRQIEAARHAELLTDADANALSHAYTFLRRAELRLQITQEHSIHAVKRNSPEFIAWARAIHPDEPSEVATARFEEEWQSCTQAARAVMERVRDAL